MLEDSSLKQMTSTDENSQHENLVTSNKKVKLYKDQLQEANQKLMK